jgi:hypothetical protein
MKHHCIAKKFNVISLEYMMVISFSMDAMEVYRVDL